MKTYKFKIFGHEYETKVVRREDDEVVISVNGQEYKAHLEESKKKSFVRPAPKMERPKVVPAEGTPKTAPPGAAKGAGAVKAPLPGLVMKLNIKVGDTVKAGDTVMIMEAMKMENSISATASGTIASIEANVGDSVMEGQVLLTINPA